MFLIEEPRYHERSVSRSESKLNTIKNDTTSVLSNWNGQKKTEEEAEEAGKSEKTKM